MERRNPRNPNHRDWDFIISQMESGKWYVLERFRNRTSGSRAKDYAERRLLITRWVDDPKTGEVILEVRLP